MSKTGWRGVGKKEGGKYDASLGGWRKGGRTIFPPGFPVGVNWGKEQQKAGMQTEGSVKKAERGELTHTVYER